MPSQLLNVDADVTDSSILPSECVDRVRSPARATRRTDCTDELAIMTAVQTLTSTMECRNPKIN